MLLLLLQDPFPLNASFQVFFLVLVFRSKRRVLSSVVLLTEVNLKLHEFLLIFKRNVHTFRFGVVETFESRL